MFEKLFASWVILIVPVFLYGSYEIYNKSTSHRHAVISIWVTGMFLFGMCFVWR